MASLSAGGGGGGGFSLLEWSRTGVNGSQWGGITILICFIFYLPFFPFPFFLVFLSKIPFALSEIIPERLERRRRRRRRPGSGGGCADRRLAAGRAQQQHQAATPSTATAAATTTASPRPSPRAPVATPTGTAAACRAAAAAAAAPNCARRVGALDVGDGGARQRRGVRRLEWRRRRLGGSGWRRRRRGGGTRRNLLAFDPTKYRDFAFY